MPTFTEHSSDFLERRKQSLTRLGQLLNSYREGGKFQKPNGLRNYVFNVRKDTIYILMCTNKSRVLVVTDMNQRK